MAATHGERERDPQEIEEEKKEAKMPPKKGKSGGAEEAKPMLGRFSSHLKVNLL